MGSSNNGCSLVTCFGGIIGSAILWALGMILTWVFQSLAETKIATAAAIVISIPIIVTVIFWFAAFFCGNEEAFVDCCSCCTVFIVAIGGILNLVATALLIVAMTEKKDDAGLLVCGSFAAIFMITSAISHCIGACGYCNGQNENGDKEEGEV